MIKMKFKKGDRIIMIQNQGIKDLIGLKGTILGNIGGNPPWAVQFDKNIYEHDCDGRGENGYCYYVHTENMKLIEEDYYHRPKLIGTEGMW